MSSQLRPLRVECDAPPYPIVQACKRIGLHHPEDVRWCRLSNYLYERNRWRGVFTYKPWKLFFNSVEEKEAACNCGAPLPKLERYTFTLLSGKELSYLLGQCGRCAAVYWE